LGSGGLCCAGVLLMRPHTSKAAASRVPANAAMTAKKDRTRVNARHRLHHYARALDMKEKGSSFARPTSHLMVCEFSGKILVA
jgi:hypothetical protein